MVKNAGMLRTRGRQPFFTAVEEDAIVDAMDIWAAQGLLLTADALRLSLKDYIKAAMHTERIPVVGGDGEGRVIVVVLCLLTQAYSGQALDASS